MLKIGRDSQGVPREGEVAQERDEVLSYLDEVLAEVRADNRGQNRKAVALLVAAVLAAVVAGMLKPGVLPGQVEWLWWTGAFFCTMGAVMLVGALHPLSSGLAGRTIERRRSYAGRLHTWSPPVRQEDEDRTRSGRSRGAFSDEALAELWARLGGQDAQTGADDLVLRIRRLGAVAQAKDRYIRRGMLLFLVAAVCCLFAVVVGQAILGA
ncbi:hypothetical protein ACFYY8_19070 [Streptosporangium sp. NPDC001559]|uniref:hypothetical protein n=1 Tax=Streptosporangium sp. NPDC001559 TaxID=3366187 RepID=UPI0036EFF3AD